MATKTNKVLVLRTCNSDMSSTNGFVWPKKGSVKCKDWDSKPKCGNGLHGLLWGEGAGCLLNWDNDAKWLVIEVNKDLIVKIDNNKVKFPNGQVVFCGDRKGATDYLLAHGAEGKAVVGAYHIVGNQRTSVSGYRGTSISGYEGISTSGNYGTSTSGKGGTSTSGFQGTSTSGRFGTSTSGRFGTSTSGDWGTSTSGDWGTSTSGHEGTSTSGDWGTSTSGAGGTSITGIEGKARSGVNGRIEIAYWDDKANRVRTVTGYIGEKGLKPDVFYQLNNKHKFVEVA